MEMQMKQFRVGGKRKKMNAIYGQLFEKVGGFRAIFSLVVRSIGSVPQQFTGHES